MSNSWGVLIEQYTNEPCNNTIGSVLNRLRLATCVYYILKMNQRLFTDE